jgi:hypothetical protein
MSIPMRYRKEQMCILKICIQYSTGVKWLFDPLVPRHYGSSLNHMLAIFPRPYNTLFSWKILSKIPQHLTINIFSLNLPSKILACLMVREIQYIVCATYRGDTLGGPMVPHLLEIDRVNCSIHPFLTPQSPRRLLKPEYFISYLQH